VANLQATVARFANRDLSFCMMLFADRLNDNLFVQYITQKLPFGLLYYIVLILFQNLFTT